MTLTYTHETYESGPLSTTTEYKLSDGSRWVRIVEEYITPDMKSRKRTRVLRSDFPGDKERRDTLTNLQGAIANASLHIYLYTPSAPAAEESTQPMLPAFVIVPGYEESAHPMTARQAAVVTALHRELELTAPVDVIPPLEKLDTAVASFGEDSRFTVEVDAEGFLDRVQVRVRLAGTTDWVSLGPSFGGVTYARLKDAARAGRRTVAPEDNRVLSA